MNVPEYLAIKFKGGKYWDSHAIITVNEAFSDEDEMNEFEKKSDSHDIFYYQLIKKS